VNSKAVKHVFLQKDRQGFVPSINYSVDLMTTPFTVYFKELKNYYKSNPNNRIHDLGSITMAGAEGRVLEIDSTNNWGEVKLLQASVTIDGNLHIITACALKDDFEGMRTDFLKTFRSFQLPH